VAAAATPRKVPMTSLPVRVARDAAQEPAGLPPRRAAAVPGHGHPAPMGRRWGVR